MKLLNYGKLYLFILLAVSVFESQAQEPIDSDRPSQSESVHLLQPKEVQIETGVLVNTYSDSEGEPSVIGSGLIRYGLTERVEARILVEEGKGSTRFYSETAQGRFPVSLSTKAGLLENHKWIPDITLISYLNLPFFSSDDENKFWAPAFIFAFGKKLNKLTLEINTGIEWDAFEGDESYQATTVLTYELGKNWKVFGEYYGQYQSAERPVNSADAGILFLLNDNLQLDLAGGSRIFSAGHNPFGTFGLSFRLPK